ncbi:MAG TPA: hypothetical protein H9722_01190 [Candidatus Mediterraneibacter pullistercoris]|nr:hypothetical protein [Candidatus Mediterraneibacter pullistercoris]
MKKKTPEQTIEILAQDIVREVGAWEYKNENGCSDPFWTDGMNMNLNRNHIIYDKRQIEKVCRDNGLPLPEEYYTPTPPEVSNYYMANLKNKRRVQMIGNREMLTTKRNKYDRDQMSLF